MAKDDPQKEKPKKSIKKCSECGMCRTICPIFRASLNEYKTPRAKAILAKANLKDTVFFDCTMCKGCETVCPLDIDFKYADIREELVKSGLAPEVNKEMIENIKKYGNPFGKIEKGQKPKKLYCC